MAQVALVWLAGRPAVSSVILGARTREQSHENLGAVGLHLTEEETARLDVASDPVPADYPCGARESSSAAGRSRVSAPDDGAARGVASTSVGR